MYSKIFYWDLLRNRKNSGFSYILLLSIIGAIISSISLGTEANKQKTKLFESTATIDMAGNISDLNDSAKEIVNQFPKLKIAADGNLEFDITAPRIIANKEEKGFKLVFDPTDKFNPSKFDFILVVNTHKIIAKVSDNEQIFNFEQFKLKTILANVIDEQGYINNYKLALEGLNFINQYSNIMYIFVFIGSLAGMIFSLGLSFLFFSLVGNILMSFMNVTPISYKTCLRLAAYTITPIFLLDVFQLAIMQQIFGMQMAIYFVLHIVYMFFAIDAFKDIEKSKMIIL